MDTIDPLRFISAFFFVIGLIGAMALLLKIYGPRLLGQKLFTTNTEDGRIKVVEVRWLDPKHKLALIRRDEVEHLLLISDKGETVIEAGIKGDER